MSIERSIRIADDEYYELEKLASRNGFLSVSSLIRYIIHKYLIDSGIIESVASPSSEVDAGRNIHTGDADSSR